MGTKEYETTDNRSVYNKLRKSTLEKTGKISCSWCGYHKNENNKDKFYYFEIETKIGTYPSWKLVSKNRKQWMKKKNIWAKGKGYYSDSIVIKYFYR